MLSRRLVRAFAQMEEKAALSQQSLMKFFDIGGFNVRYFGGCFRQIGLVGLFDISYNASVVAARAGIAEQLTSLTGSYTSKQALTFDIADNRRQKARCIADHLQRTADQLAVFSYASKGGTIRILLGHIPK